LATQTILVPSNQGARSSKRRGIKKDCRLCWRTIFEARLSFDRLKNTTWKGKQARAPKALPMLTSQRMDTTGLEPVPPTMSTMLTTCPRNASDVSGKHILNKTLYPFTTQKHYGANVTAPLPRNARSAGATA
jgi:hypothetical protein